MAKINLLPWRAAVRKQREREFYMMLGGAFLAGVLAVLVWVYWMNMRIDSQDARNAYLTQQSKDLDAKLEEIKRLEQTKSALLTRKQIIEQLQANRSQMVHLFDEMVKTIPDGARLSALKQAGDTLTLEGLAQSNANVATYMRSLDASPWLMRSDLQKTEAKSNEKRDRFAFGLTVKLTDPEAKKKAKEEADAKANGGVAPPPKAPAKPASGAASPATPPEQTPKPLPAVATPGSPS